MTMKAPGMRWFLVKRGMWLLFFLGGWIPLKAQLGGSYTYQYLQLPVSARSAALGGVDITSATNDLSSAWYNPALLQSEMDGQLAVNHALNAGNVNHGLVAYGRDLRMEGVTAYAGLMYNTYGRIPAYDENGVQIGSFNASEFALGAGVGYTAEKLTYGANLKFLFSQLETYQSVGMAIDLGALYNDQDKNFQAGLVMRNIGTQFTAYAPGNRDELPFEIQLGVSKRLEYLPLRVSLVGHNLQQLDIRYDDPNSTNSNNIFSTDTAAAKKYIGDKILRHLIVSGEFFFGTNFRARVGYDYMQQKEMVLTTYRGLTGFSLGFGMQVQKYTIDYGYEIASVAGGNHYFSISTDIDALFRR